MLNPNHRFYLKIRDLNGVGTNESAATLHSCRYCAAYYIVSLLGLSAAFVSVGSGGPAALMSRIAQELISTDDVVQSVYRCLHLKMYLCNIYMHYSHYTTNYKAAKILFTRCAILRLKRGRN